MAIYCGQTLLGIIMLSQAENTSTYEKSSKYVSEVILK